MPKWTLRAAPVLFLLVLAGGGFWVWRAQTLERMREETDIQLDAAWKNQDFARVRLLAEHLPNEERRDIWLSQVEEAQIAQAISQNDAFTIRELRAGQPSPASNEAEALLLARAALHEQDRESFESIWATWSQHGEHTQAWLFLEVDALILENDLEAARELMLNHAFTGQAKSNRQLRLALVSSNDPRETLRRIDEAVSAAPDNPDALAFRGQVLESLGEFPGAQADYVRAVLLKPESALFWDQLGGFFHRRQQYALAVDTWEDGFARTEVTEFWIKAWFWQRVSGQGSPVSAPPDTGPFAEYAQYLASIPSGTWWQPDTFASLPYASRILEQRQETFWLRLLQALADEDLTTAQALLRSDPFANRSWAPRLKQAIKLLIRWQRGESDATPAKLMPRADDHQFFRLLADANEPTEALHFTRAGLDAWAAAFLANGWLAAAFEFDEISEDQPAWYTYGQVQARRQLVSIDRALQRLDSTQNDATLNLLEAELQWAQGNKDAATSRWKELLHNKNEAGRRAGLMLATFYASEGRWTDLAQLATDHPAWTETLRGKEIQARAAVAQGDAETALEIYQSIADESTEAKVFLARLAFQQKDWPRARALTEQLILQNPNEPAFYQNLAAIQQAESQP